MGSRKEINYKQFSLQPYMRPRENIDLKTQRLIFALRTKINHIKANFCSSKYIEKCDKYNFEMDNIHLFKCTRRNIQNINYNHILNGTVHEQREAIKYINDNQINNEKKYIYNLVILFVIHYLHSKE